jgi:hypothetical protein
MVIRREVPIIIREGSLCFGISYISGGPEFRCLRRLVIPSNFIIFNIFAGSFRRNYFNYTMVVSSHTF